MKYMCMKKCFYKDRLWSEREIVEADELPNKHFVLASEAPPEEEPKEDKIESIHDVQKLEDKAIEDTKLVDAADQDDQSEEEDPDDFLG